MIPSVVSPMVPVWHVDDSKQFVESVSNFHELKRDFVSSNFPIITGSIAVGAPYLAGVALVAFGPTPYHKALGVSFLIPGPQDAVYFAAGYTIGKWIEDDVPEWLI